MNAGINLAPLDLNKEYTFELQSVEVKENQQTKFGPKNRVETVWKEAGKDKDYHRVWVRFNESYNEKSKLIEFLRRVSPRPILPGSDVKLGDYLDLGMKILVYVQARIDDKTGQMTGYYDFVPVRIRPAGSLAPTAPATNTATYFPQLQAALRQHARGAQSAGDVFSLLVGKVPTEIVQAFVAEDKAGRISYPIA